MRVDPNMVPDILAALQQSQLSLNTALQQVSTGKSVNVPSDNPTAGRRDGAEHHRNGERRPVHAKCKQRADTVQTASSALNSVVTSLTQAVSLGTEGANGTNSSANLQASRTQVQGILSERGVAGKYVGTRGPTYSAEPPAPPRPTPRIHPRRPATPTTATTT